MVRVKRGVSVGVSVSVIVRVKRGVGYGEGSALWLELRVTFMARPTVRVRVRGN